MNTRPAPEKHLKSIGPNQRAGSPAGIYSVCSSQRIVLEAVLQQAAEDESPLLVESTCNQVNQFGGYSGMTPKEFSDYILGMCRRLGFPREKIMLGGDHLGPHVWRAEPSEKAMEKAENLVAGCVVSGYSKIHLDASMPLGDDSGGWISHELAARRTARLCRAAEDSAKQLPQQSPAPVYVIGAEVPTPGGSLASPENVPVSSPDEVAGFIDVCRSRFSEAGLSDAWNRVIAVVVQPGIDFGENWVKPFDPEAAHRLSAFHDKLEGAMTYEIHAADYQSPTTLEEMVQHHFALLKIGPCLTHAFREAVFALSHIEDHLFANHKDVRRSWIREMICRVMKENPGHWKSHHRAETPSDWTVLFSYLDRVRYYWARLEVEDALARLSANLAGRIELPLLSQYMPSQYKAVAEGIIAPDPALLIRHKIREALFPYAAACRMTSGS
ncbi:MAG: class II D-tagatose-bisphosphate aldolase non-catalytic subunit [Thermodesulfobacteriota bacterium]